MLSCTDHPGAAPIPHQLAYPHAHRPAFPETHQPAYPDAHRLWSSRRAQGRWRSPYATHLHRMNAALLRKYCITHYSDSAPWQRSMPIYNDWDVESIVQGWIQEGSAEPPKFRKCTAGNHMHVHVHVSAIQF